MTDARLPEKWLNDRRFLRLSDGGMRLYVVGLLFAVSNRTDGRLDDADLVLLPATNPSKSEELEKAGLWTRSRDGWKITDFAATQTSKSQLDVLDAFRRRERDKKARQRAKEKAKKEVTPAGGSRGTVPGDIPGDTSRDGTEGRQRTGKDRQGQAAGESEIEDERPGFEAIRQPRPNLNAYMPSGAVPRTP